MIDTNKMRQMARGGQYTPRMIREALWQAADALDAAQAGIADRDNLTNNLAISMAAMVDASGGRIVVADSVLEDIGGKQIEKSRDESIGAIVYTTSRVVVAANDQAEGSGQ